MLSKSPILKELAEIFRYNIWFTIADKTFIDDVWILELV